MYACSIDIFSTVDIGAKLHLMLLLIYHRKTPDLARIIILYTTTSKYDIIPK